MMYICRDDFIYYLRQGKVFVLGTFTGTDGVLTVQGTSNGIYMHGNKKRNILSVAIRTELENLMFNTNNKTYIEPYVPKLLSECTDEEKENIDIDDDCKKISINNRNSVIKFGRDKIAENKYNQYITIKGVDEEVKRSIQNTSYGNADKSYRTTYYYGGTITVCGKKYGYVVEGLELDNGKRYVPKYFIVYIIETNSFNFLTHSSVSLSHVEEELKSLNDEYNKMDDEETDDEAMDYE